ncbi:branched-chain amino acid aminotransferase [Niallia sp. Krafla_26]|uniref:branched-chain amino acid aminotransferase n=1 Tax=Niallia sp. Krafla_26 TaxID=3064703 RepID=UPI003D167205
MLKNELKKYIEKQLTNQKPLDATDAFQIELYEMEKEFLEQHPTILQELEKKVEIVGKDPMMRFQEVYIEKCNKETDELIAEESFTFLDQHIDYFLHHIEEFMYLESPWFEIIGVDAISFEVDSVFKTYDMMLGLKLQKKHEKSIKIFLSTNLGGDHATFDLMFNSNEGIWELNFSINHLQEFNENWTIGDAYLAAYQIIFRLREYVEEGVE